MTHDYRAALDTLGLALIDLPPAGTYRGVSIVGNTAYVAGHIGWHDGGPSVVGTLGDDIDIAAGKIAARDAALTALGTLERELGSLDRIAAIPKLFGMVRATDSFGQHPAVIDGASKLLLDVLGPDVATHARSAVAMSSLPFGAAVEIEMTVIIHD